MAELNLITLLIAILIGCYVQTVSGFASGMIVMSVVAISGATSLPFAAIIVGIIALMHGVFFLSRKHRDTRWRYVGLLLIGMLPTLFLGVWLLNYLSVHALAIAKLILGIFVTVAAVFLVLKPEPFKKISIRRSWLGAGLLGGGFGGLFSVSGPPLAYLLYRQPLSIDSIRATLIATFTVSAFLRLTIVASEGAINWQVVSVALYSVPVVIAGTWIGHRYPPKYQGQELDSNKMRRLAFVLLFLIGCSVLVNAVLQLL